MAEVVTKLVEELVRECAQHVECRICLDSLREPIRTPCNHIFCKGCIERHLGVSSSCPLCNANITRRSLNECPRHTYLIQATKDVVRAVRTASPAKADWSPFAFPQSQACERRESFDRWAPQPEDVAAAEATAAAAAAARRERTRKAEAEAESDSGGGVMTAASLLRSANKRARRSGKRDTVVVFADEDVNTARARRSRGRRYNSKESQEQGKAVVVIEEEEEEEEEVEEEGTKEEKRSCALITVTNFGGSGVPTESASVRGSSKKGKKGKQKKSIAKASGPRRGPSTAEPLPPSSSSLPAHPKRGHDGSSSSSSSSSSSKKTSRARKGGRGSSAANQQQQDETRARPKRLNSREGRAPRRRQQQPNEEEEEILGGFDDEELRRAIEESRKLARIEERQRRREKVEAELVILQSTTRAPSPSSSAASSTSAAESEEKGEGEKKESEEKGDGEEEEEEEAEKESTQEEKEKEKKEEKGEEEEGNTASVEAASLVEAGELQQGIEVELASVEEVETMAPDLGFDSGAPENLYTTTAGTTTTTTSIAAASAASAAVVQADQVPGTDEPAEVAAGLIAPSLEPEMIDGTPSLLQQQPASKDVEEEGIISCSIEGYLGDADMTAVAPSMLSISSSLGASQEASSVKEMEAAQKKMQEVEGEMGDIDTEKETEPQVLAATEDQETCLPVTPPRTEASEMATSKTTVEASVDDGSSRADAADSGAISTTTTTTTTTTAAAATATAAATAAAAVADAASSTAVLEEKSSSTSVAAATTIIPSTPTPTPTPPPPAISDPVVLITGCADRKREKTVKRAAISLGWRVTREFSPEVTHVVTTQTPERYARNRTLKFMLAVATGKWVVSEEWVLDSARCGIGQDATGYELRGEGDFVTEAPRRAREALGGNYDSPHRVLCGQAVTLFGQFPHSSREDIGRLVVAAGGVLIPISACRLHPGCVRVVCDPEGEGADDPSLVQSITGVRPLDLYWLYDSITDFRLQDPEMYWLDEIEGEGEGEEEEGTEAANSQDNLSQQLF